MFPVSRISDRAEQEEAGRSCADIIVETLAACFGQSPVLEAYSEAIGVGIVLMTLPPVIILPISYFIFREKIGWQAILGTALAIAGVAVLFLA